ncbi:MAG: hypothetical protein U9N30_02320 [Campylobacterota bacterium]|nr:hypothetical protein [Campylobacterota bacterium]
MIKKLKNFYTEFFFETPKIHKYQKLLKKFEHRVEKLQNKTDDESTEEYLIVNKLIEKLKIKIQKEQAV